MIDFGVRIWPLAFLVAMAAGLTWLAYRHTTPRLSGIYRSLLPALRFLVLSVLLALLFEPAWRNRVVDVDAPILAVLVDESESMDRVDGRIELPFDDSELRLFGFGHRIRALPNIEAARDTAPRTDIASALTSVRAESRNENLRGILLLSDGLYNTGHNPVHVAEVLGIPIHTVVMGDTTEQRDLVLTRAETNSIVYASQETPVDVSLLLQGYEEASVAIRMYSGDSLVATRAVHLVPGENRATLTYVPIREGLNQLAVVADELEAEVSVENNRRTFSARVLSRSQHILLIAAAPHPDVASMHALLSRQDGRTVHSLVQRAAGTFYEGSLPSSLDTYDLMVLMGFPGHGASLEALRTIAQANVPVLFVLGEQTDLELLRTQLATILPAVPTRNQMPFDEASLLPTAAGARHPVLNVLPTYWSMLPPLSYAAGRWNVSPDAHILANAQLRGVALDEPLLVVQSKAGVRSAALLGAGTWRWLNLADDPAASPRIWPAILDNLVQWLTTPEDDRKVRVAPVASTFDGRDPVVFAGQAYDESLRPVTGAAVSLELTAPDETVYPYSMASMGNGLYELSIPTLPEGSYTYTVQAIRMGATLGTDRGGFAVGRLGLEHQKTRSDASLMRQLAWRSGGHAFSRGSLGDLPAILRSDRAFVPLERATFTEQSLWRWPWMLAIVVLLLALEWVLRKRCSLV